MFTGPGLAVQGCDRYWYPVKFRHMALSAYLPDIYWIVLRYFLTTMKRKSLLGVYKL